MATAEFIIGRSADDAAERKQEVRKIFWALLAALLIHLVIGYLLASFHDVLFSKTVPVEEEKPVELTFVDLPAPAPAVPKNSMFMETDETKQSAAPPKEKTFESNANSIAASQDRATGGAPLPSQEGKDRPAVDWPMIGGFATRSFWAGGVISEPFHGIVTGVAMRSLLMCRSCGGTNTGR